MTFPTANCLSRLIFAIIQFLVISIAGDKRTHFSENRSRRCAAFDARWDGIFYIFWLKFDLKAVSFHLWINKIVSKVFKELYNIYAFKFLFFCFHCNWVPFRYFRDLDGNLFLHETHMNVWHLFIVNRLLSEYFWLGHEYLLKKCLTHLSLLGEESSLWLLQSLVVESTTSNNCPETEIVFGIRAPLFSILVIYILFNEFAKQWAGTNILLHKIVKNFTLWYFAFVRPLLINISPMKNLFPWKSLQQKKSRDYSPHHCQVIHNGTVRDKREKNDGGLKSDN